MSNHNILEELALCVCEVFGITKHELLTKQFKSNSVDARKVFVYISMIYARKYTLERIGKHIDYNYDRVNKYLIGCNDLLTTNLEFREQFTQVECKYLHKDFAPYNLQVNYVN